MVHGGIRTPALYFVGDSVQIPVEEDAHEETRREDNDEGIVHLFHIYHTKIC